MSTRARAIESSAARRNVAAVTGTSCAHLAAWRTTRRLASSGRFELFRVAARGELGPGCYVLKTTPRESTESTSAALLQRESLVPSEVVHPNLTSVLWSKLDEGRPGLLMPYYEGLTLCRLLAFKGALPVAYALSIARQVAAALAALHAAGWLHGQIRPGHVIVSPQGQATLIDLTFARRLDSGECDCGNSFVTADRNSWLAYAAPEFFSVRSRLRAASDVYGLGVVLFKSIAGRLPFEGLSGRRLMEAQRTAAPPDLRQLRPGLSMEVAELVRRMLAKEALRRPSAEELVRWLAEIEIEELAA